MWRGLHFAGRWAEAPEGSWLMLAVLVSLVEKHPESLVDQKPRWQAEQPLGGRRERERGRMRQERWEKGWTTRERGKRNETKGNDVVFERKPGGDGGEREKEGSQGEWWERCEEEKRGFEGAWEFDGRGYGEVGWWEI